MSKMGLATSLARSTPGQEDRALLWYEICSVFETTHEESMVFLVDENFIGNRRNAVRFSIRGACSCVVADVQRASAMLPCGSQRAACPRCLIVNIKAV